MTEESEDRRLARPEGNSPKFFLFDRLRRRLPSVRCLWEADVSGLDHRVRENHVLNNRFTRGVSRVRLNASATFLIASAWVGYG